MRLFILVLATSIVTCACSTLVYQEPISGPRARVRFATDSKDISVLRTYSDKNCSTNEAEWMRLRNGVLINASPKRLGISLWRDHENAAKEVYVGAGSPIYGLFIGGEMAENMIYRCGTSFLFTFQDAYDYEVRFRWSRKQCYVTISQISDPQSGAEIKQLAEFTNQVTEANKGCLDAFNAKRF
ncbi:hypothetical protein [Methyloversatilis sp. MC4-4]|uniref:hypothetical protein n=1 Tax=Methyloversatilis sp. MC4-4 TaxID=3132824 RepID=UPI003CE6BB0A